MSLEACEVMRADKNFPQKIKDRFYCMGITSVGGDTREGRNIWEKSWRTWVHMLEQGLEKHEFFVKTDTDSFLAVENLKAYLGYFDPEQDWYIGHTLLHQWDQEVIFNTGIGYVISRGTARRLLPQLKSMAPNCDGRYLGCCEQNQANEDAHMGSCMSDLGVLPTNQLDRQGRVRFHIFKKTDHHVIYREDSWYWMHTPTHMQEGPECCNPYPLVLHGYKEEDPLKNFQMLVIEHNNTASTPLGKLRVDEYPDHGPFLYDPVSANFKMSRDLRKPCALYEGKGLPGCGAVH
jgi:hypothetical protein